MAWIQDELSSRSGATRRNNAPRRRRTNPRKDPFFEALEDRVALTSFTLSPSTTGLVNKALSEGPGIKNANYINAYNGIYDDVVANGKVNSGATYWFSQAGNVNGYQVQPNAVGAFIWNYTKAAVQSEGGSVTDPQMQVASDAIATKVFTDLRSNGYVFSDNPADSINFAPKSIVDNDATTGLRVIQSYNPNVQLDYAVWGGTLFAQTSLDDKTYAQDYGLQLSIASRDCMAISSGMDAGVYAGLPYIFKGFWSNLKGSFDLDAAGILDPCGRPAPSGAIPATQVISATSEGPNQIGINITETFSNGSSFSESSNYDVNSGAWHSSLYDADALKQKLDQATLDYDNLTLTTTFHGLDKNGADTYQQSTSTRADGRISATISGAGDQTSLSNASINLAPDAKATVNGDDNDMLVQAGGQIILNGSRNQLTADANSETCVTGSDNNVTAGPNSVCAVRGNNDILTSTTGDTQTTPTTGTNVVLALADKILSGDGLASQLGAQFGTLIAGSNFFARVGAGALGSTIATLSAAELGNLKDSLIKAVSGQSTELDTSTAAALKQAGGNFVSSLGSQTISSLGTLLVADAAQQLGVSGFAGKVLTTTGATIANQILTNATRANTALLAGLNTAQIIESVGTALGNLIGSKIAGQVINSNNIGQALLASVGGSYVGLAYGTEIGSTLGSTLGIGTVALPWTSIVNMTASELIDALILPGVGAILGTIAGEVVGAEVFSFLDDVTGGLFSRLINPSIWEYQYIAYDQNAGSFYTSEALDHSKNTDANLRAGTHSLTNAILAGVNAVIQEVGGQVDPASAQNLAWVEWVGKNKPWGNADYTLGFQVGSQTTRIPAAGNPDRLVEDGVEFDLSQIKFINGDPVKLRAFNAWQQSVTNPGSGASLVALTSDLSIADDYERYLDNTAPVNTLITSAPDSAFSVGWVSTLLEAETLGLNQSYKIEVTNANTSGAGSLSQALADAQRLGLVNIDFHFTAPTVDEAAADKAIYQYSLAIQNSGPDASLFRDIGELYQAEGNIPAAIYAFTHALAIDPSQAVYYVQIAELYRSEGDFTDAVYAYTNALGINPTLEPVWLSLAGAYSQLAAADGGAQKVTDLTNQAYVYNRALGLDPKNTTLWTDLASTEAQIAGLSTGNAEVSALQQAAYAYLRDLQVNPNDTTAQTNLSATYTRLAPLLVGPASGPLATAAHVENEILSFQLPNGAILVSNAPAGYDSAGKPYYMADVYFSGTALYWALGASGVADVKLLSAARNWVAWCLANADAKGMLNRYYYYPDGSTAAPSIPPDAEDSNSAMILAVLARYAQQGGDTSFIASPAVKAKLELIAGVMLGLQQPNGLTWGSSTYPISDLEDNSEVYAGLRGDAYLEAKVYHATSTAQAVSAAAARVQSGILDNLYDPASGLFDWALNSPSDLSKGWYPDTISQVWPILYGVISPSSGLAHSLMGRVDSAWSSATDPQKNWADRLDSASVATAAAMTGDFSPVAAALHTIASAAFPVNGYPLYNTTVADYGLTLGLLGPAAVDQAVATAGATRVKISPKVSEPYSTATPLTLTVITPPQYGTVVINPDNTFLYTPRAGFSGADQFVYRVTDGYGGSDTATVIINPALVPFTPANPAPAEAGQAYTHELSAQGNGGLFFDYRVVAGTLPGGLVLNANGKLSGLPTTSGTFHFTVAASNLNLTTVSSILSVTVSPGAATHFALSLPKSATAGAAFFVTVTALDAYDNVATGYSGTVNTSSSDASAVLPAHVACTNGVGRLAIDLKRAGLQTITVTANAPTVRLVSGQVAVSAAAATKLVLGTPPSAKARTPFVLQVTALDAYGNVATGYTGPITLIGTDSSSPPPSLVSLIKGVGSFSVRFNRAGRQTLTAVDLTKGRLAGASVRVLVLASPFK